MSTDSAPTPPRVRSSDRSGSDPASLSRRSFLARSALGATGISAALSRSGNFAYGAAQDDVMRVGLIGCGGRGTGAAADAVNAAERVEIAAMGDLFRDRLETSRRHLRDAIGDRLTATESTSFVGFDAYEKVLATDVDYVILATPPGFRPLHIRAALEAGKHVFAEKPVAVDSAGVRSVLESAKRAEEKNLGIVAGTQNRHHRGVIETMRRIHDGEIGRPVSAHIVRLGQGVWLRERQPGMSDMEWQCRNWYYFTWLSGDGIVEQHIHQIDLVNWALDSNPEKAVGVGGRQVRVDPSYGQIFDNFANEFVYPDDVRVQSMHRHWEGGGGFSEDRELIIGTRGRAVPGDRIEGENEWSFDEEMPRPSQQQEHADLIASIRSGDPLNEGERIAESTLTAIMGREAAYTGQEITWEQALNADLDLGPDTFEFGPAPFPPTPEPGRTPLERST